MENNDFEYKYSAPTKQERKEIESIRNSYIPQSVQHSKLDRLRKLHARVKNVPLINSLTIGIIGILIFGLGLTMVLEWGIVLWGVVVGVVGCAIMGVAYPIHLRLEKFMKLKYSEEIIKISDELLNDEK